MKRQPKKKRFKLVKVKRKPEQFPKGGVILQPSDRQAEYIINLYRNIIKEAPSLKSSLEYQKENLEKEKAFDKYLEEWLDNIKNGISNIK